ncbi:DNA-processing protein DprA [Papillibacter cinnamivorans]|uniref:DNA processing protein n=1 Tax=Papillibacter cinnamivorans DSM 12816 TaxID=1122930 RepID=A0A1W1ZE88_9FIRM|nr:DNA-processing protein DprA [Papillibacter cinnamivorans]SMC46795.1 DNA processing protein [Papillibacter cinnamivorans DSM 12816]
MSSLKYWLWLSTLRGVGSAMKLRILDHFGTPENAYYADDGEYRLIPDISEAALGALGDKALDNADRILGECERTGQRIVTLQDAEYPDRLKNIYDPPCVLYTKGKVFAFDEEVAVAVVGTRECTPYGLSTAERLARQLARSGALIVSGMALGADTAAHKGALRAGAPTAAVLGCGLDIVYPRENRFLYEDISVRGGLLSEYPPGTPALRSNFPARNRIISGLCLGTVIVEAPERSGALITARTALEQGRDVFAVPGNVDAPKSAGTNRLIQEGAILVTGAWDVLREYVALYPHKITECPDQELFGPGYGGRRYREEADLKVASPAVRLETGEKKEVDKEDASDYIDLKTEGIFTQDQREILLSLSQGPKQVDMIIEETQIPAPRALSALTLLEVRGTVRQHKGKRFEATAPVRY